MTARTERTKDTDLFTLNSGKVVAVDWGWIVGRTSPSGHPHPEFPYGFQTEDGTEDVELTDDEAQEIEEFILANIAYEPDNDYFD